MARSSMTAIFLVAIVIVISRSGSVQAEKPFDLAGRWTLNRELSQFPPEVGFSVDWAPSPTGSGASSSGSRSRGGRGSNGGSNAGAATFMARPESEDDFKRVQQLTAEVRAPAARFTIVDSFVAVTITDEGGHPRTFHPDGKEEWLQLDGVPVKATAKRDGGRLVIVYKPEQGRELRYSYSRASNPTQLVVDIQFVGNGGGDHVRRVYEPAGTSEPLPRATTSAPSPTVTKPGPEVAATSVSGSGAAAVSAPVNPPTRSVTMQPGAEFKGLTKLGIVVEDLSAQAVACGLSQNALETAVSKRLSSGGFKVRRNSDEDTYVYVSVITTSLSTGLCVSRYDVFLYTHTTATLSYQAVPVLVQVSLFHKGGIAGGASAAHAEGVLRGVQEYVDQFSTLIRDADK